MSKRFHFKQIQGVWHCFDNLLRHGVQITGQGRTPELAYNDCCDTRIWIDDPDFFRGYAK